MKDFAPDESMKPVKPVCRSCSGDDVVFDAYGEWDSENQMMTLRTHFDEAKCEGQCGGRSTEVDWIETGQGSDT